MERLNNQTDVQICNQCVRYDHESYFLLPETARQTLVPVVVHCVTVVPTAARISATDTMRCTTTLRQIKLSSIPVVPPGQQESDALEAVSSHADCFQQPYTVIKFRPSLSDISWRENSPSRSLITQPHSNSVSC
ncbi:hypothetical protein TNCV_3571711 [Trichonephila clavipes]|nr:hypothetical protein TNCV_3571711 [Trichonephila clavipes]